MSALTHEPTCPLLRAVQTQWACDFLWFRTHPLAVMRHRLPIAAERDLVASQEGWRPADSIQIVAEQGGWLSVAYSNVEGRVATYVVQADQDETTLAMPGNTMPSLPTATEADR